MLHHIFLLRPILFATLILFLSTLCSQSDTIPKFVFSGYGEIYYSYDFSNPASHEKEDFFYNHKRHNEVNFNIIMAKVNYSDRMIRANLGLMAGNYAQYNLQSEPSWAQNIYEANLGVKLSRLKNMWIDAGILTSHIGFESAIGADCWTVTRSLLAENSPYYESGIRYSYTDKKEKFYLALMYLNGWQKIRKSNFVQNPSFGMQFSYKLSTRLTLNYCNFLGTDKPDSINAFRTFHNLHIHYLSGRKLDIITGFDLGRDKYTDNNYGSWFSPIVILRYNANKKANFAFRAEYYADQHNIIVSTRAAEAFKVLGLSTNFDYKIFNQLSFRIEAKYLSSEKIIFQDLSKSNTSITSTLQLKI